MLSMLSLTAFLAICLVTQSALAEQQLIFASASSPVQSRTNGVANEKELIFSSTLPESNNQQSSSTFALQQQLSSTFNTSPTSFYHGRSNSDTQNSNLPTFASRGSLPTSSPNVASGFLEPRQISQPEVVPGIPTNFASSLTTSSPQQPTVGQSGPPVFASFSGPSKAPTAQSFNSLRNEHFLQLSKGAEKFSLEYMAKISHEHLRVPHRSYMVSPLSVWSLLMLLTEGAQANTLAELRRVLNIENNTPSALRAAYREITKRLNAQTPAVETAAFQAIFTDINKPVSRDYENIVEREYATALTPVNFADVNTTFMRINKDINTATRGLLPHSVLPQDLVDVQLLMISSLYFKGKWRHPFDSSNTHLVPFYDEAGNVTGDVEMMTQSGEFTYTQIKELDCHVLELPYGESNRMSMLILLPKKGVTVNSVINALPKVSISSILEQLNEEESFALHEGVPQEVEVFLPKFTTQSHFSIRYILEKMGLYDIFQPAYANLTNISPDVYVSSIFQSTRIIVNEEGTEAAALTAASLINKASPVRFFIDRPFAYMIVERQANLLMFAGEVKSHE